MTNQEIDKHIENLFTVARLHGWCDQVDEALWDLRSLQDQASVDELRGRLTRRIASDAMDKESAALSLIILRYAGVPLTELLEHAHRHLKGRLYINDFRFLVRHFLDNHLPLPRTLTYDISERLFFSIESIYDSVVRDFKKVPFRNAEAVVFYLALQNCRIDLNTQNKELISIILLHIEIRLPDLILADVVDYLDQNATIGEKWQEQRRTIDLARPLPQQLRQGRDSSPPEQHPESPESATTPSAPEAWPEHPLRIGQSEAERSQKSPARPASRPAALPAAASPESVSAPAGKVPDATEPGSADRNPESARELGQPPRARRKGRAEAPSIHEPTSTQKAAAARAPDAPSAEPVRQAVPLVNGSAGKPPEKEEPIAAQPVVRPEKSPRKPTSEGLQYEEFMVEGRERGIILSKLDQRRWRKDKTAEDAPRQAAAEPRPSDEHGSRRRFRSRSLILIAAGIIALLLLLLVLSRAGPFSVSPPRPVPVVEPEASVMSPPAEKGAVQAIAPGVPPDPTLEEGRFRIEPGASGIVWFVTKGDTLYDLFLYLRSQPAARAIDARLRDLGRLSWIEFLSHMEGLNAADRPGSLDFDRIYPQETYLLLKK